MTVELRESSALTEPTPTPSPVSHLAPELDEALAEICRTPVLLVASDFDGTLAPLAADPDAAEAHREALLALKALASLPQTHVAIISGRALSDLAKKITEPLDAHLVGSHGSEFEAGFTCPLTEELAALLTTIRDLAHRTARHAPGAHVESKPAAIAFHYRNADPELGPAAAQQLVDAAAQYPNLHVRHGKMVVELSVIKTNKGLALGSLRQRLGASAVLFLGDDITDEDAFATLTGPDIGLKVGTGQTAAKFNIPDTLTSARLLALIAERRQEWIAGSQAIPIEHHSLLSDQRTCALITPTGRVTWLCLPRVDSPGIFAELLGGPAAGYFEIRPADYTQSPRQQYLGNTFLLNTDWGPFRVIDYLDCSSGRPHQRAGRTDLIRVVEGSGRVRITFAPKLDFGAVETRLRIMEGGLEVEGSIEPCVLYAPGLQWTISREGRHEIAVVETTLQYQPLILELRYGTCNLSPSQLPEARRRQQSARFWDSWAESLQLPAFHKAEVLRSALVLRALCYGPTGAIMAAATTSLPESAGGTRNWDYRFCWPRDAAMAAAALAKLEAAGPAMRLLDWILGILHDRETPTFLRPVYTVTGGHLGTEGVISELSGYRGSRPVRVGNSAAHQIQLDVLGPVAELLALLAQKGASLTQEHWKLTESMVGAVAERWTEADHGIWELRGTRKQHVHSKVMCWKTVDSALQVAENLGRRRNEWKQLRQTIAEDIFAKAWHHQLNAFTASYGSDQCDASTLTVGLSGLVPPDDPRFASTVAAVEKHLRDGPTVYRYRYDDGLPGIEGGFNLCTAWLIESYALLGRKRDALELFDHYLALAGPTGLIAEEFDPVTRQSLGNYPQAYSHIGLINCALRLDH